MSNRPWFNMSELEYIQSFTPTTKCDVFASDLDRTMIYSLGSSGLKNNYPVLAVAELKKNRCLM